MSANVKMRRGGTRYYKRLGKLAFGIKKKYADPDPEARKERARLAGIASGKARRARKAKGKPYGKIARKLHKANLPELSALASQIKRLNESAGLLL